MPSWNVIVTGSLEQTSDALQCWPGGQLSSPTQMPAEQVSGAVQARPSLQARPSSATVATDWQVRFAWQVSVVQGLPSSHSALVAHTWQPAIGVYLHSFAVVSQLS